MSALLPHPDTPLTGTALITRAEQLCAPQAPVSPEHSNDQVRALFTRNEALETLAVVEAGRPIGLINRHQFMEQYARPFGHDVFGRKSCTAFMDAAPVIVDAATPIESLMKTAVEAGARALRDGFITTAHGQYLGLGTGYALMKAMADIEADKTRQLHASIGYASLIQRSHLAESDRALRAGLADHALLWEPRDVVGGDAYFFRPTAGGLLGCVFDCTGHGVPGAFMTLIALSFLEQSVDGQTAPIDPGELLTRMNGYIKRVLQQRASATPGGESSNDGLDALLFVLPPDQRSLRYASSRLLLVVAPEGDAPLAAHPGERWGIGYADTPDDARWTTREVALGARSLVVIPTDGVTDQIGGPRQIAYGKRRLVGFIAERREAGARLACLEFQAAFADWQGRQRRRDDLTLLAFRTTAS